MLDSQAILLCSTVRTVVVHETMKDPHGVVAFAVLLVVVLQFLLEIVGGTEQLSKHHGVVNVTDLFSSSSSSSEREGGQQHCQDCHRFDGVGGISGGGATSRLLVEYPDEVQSEILDFLFLPNFGASLQILKVEIGGDAQSTDGSETSHMHSPNDLNLHRGYEWWILKEAKKRNPNILTYGLPWAFPGWVTDDNRNPFQNMDLVTNYTYQWVKGAKEVHGIDIDYLGIWNEIGTNREYLLRMRKLLDDNGFHNTKLVSNDGYTDLLPKLVNDTQYLNAIDVLGFHYPSDDDPETWKLANSFQKPIWAAEESSSYDDLNGAACWARVIASHYVMNNMTANIMWNLVASYSHGTNWYGSSMLTANQPWTGYYEWEQMPVVWATAHYTQFTQPGWQLLPVGRGSGELASGGYYLTLVSPDLQYFTLVVVKISKDHGECTRPKLWDWNTEDEKFRISIQLPYTTNSSDIQTWYSNLEQEESRLFEKLDQRNNNGISKVSSVLDDELRVLTFDITLKVEVGGIFTVTNQPGVGNKGQSTEHYESDASFPLPYLDNFNEYECDNCYAKYLSDQMGAFEIQAVVGPDYELKKRLVQMTPELPVTWWQEQVDRGPVSVVGMTEWEDVEASISFALPDKSTAACISTRTDQFWERGVTLCANSSHWYASYGGANLTGFDPSADNAIAYGGNTIDNSEHTMVLSTLGQHVDGYIDNNHVLSESIRAGDSGFVAIGASAYSAVQYQTIQIKPIGEHWVAPSRSSPKNSLSLALSFGQCTPNGLSHDSEWFDLTANWQLRHLPSGLCVTAFPCGDDSLTCHSGSSSLLLAYCQHDFPPQQFRHPYTLIRNGRDEFPLSNQLGDLCATKDGIVSLEFEKSCAGETSSYFSKWALYPNTHQLRNAFGYREWPGNERAICLRVVQGETIASNH